METAVTVVDLQSAAEIPFQPWLKNSGSFGERNLDIGQTTYAQRGFAC